LKAIKMGKQMKLRTWGSQSHGIYKLPPIKWLPRNWNQKIDLPKHWREGIWTNKFYHWLCETHWFFYQGGDKPTFDDGSKVMLDGYLILHVWIIKYGFDYSKPN